MLVVVDTFDYDDYPVSVLPSEDVNQKISDFDGRPMQKVIEVYSLSLDIEEQLSEGRSWNI